MITNDGRNLPILEITPENYKVPAGEERFYHVKMEVKSFDQHTGERLSHPYIQKFARVDFEGGMLSDLRQQGYDMVILHNPKEWAEKHAAEQAKTQAEKAAEAEAKAKAEKEKLKEELRKEILAEEKAKAEAAEQAKTEDKGGKKGKKDASAKAEAETEEPDLS